MMLDYSDLSRTISHALRHEPWIYELEIDDDGWVGLQSLLDSLRPLKIEWASLGAEDVERMIIQSDKKRHELSDNNDKIRALYGHTIPGKLKKEPARPPEILYHGTSPKSAKLIYREGIKPMTRQYVHLAVNIQDAERVGKRKSCEPVILIISASDAFSDGIKFYRGNDKIWLSDFVSPIYIETLEN